MYLYEKAVSCLALTRNEECFKMYTSDTGLFVTLAFMDSDYTENSIYNKLVFVCPWFTFNSQIMQSSTCSKYTFHKRVDTRYRE